jgi:hypothetical protein
MGKNRARESNATSTHNKLKSKVLINWGIQQFGESMPFKNILNSQKVTEIMENIASDWFFI